jgi:D-lactate dehydrogenase
MKVAFFDTHRFDRKAFEQANSEFKHDLVFFESRLTEDTAKLAYGCETVCAFVNDRLNADVLESLAGLGVKLIALRSAGFNHVDLSAAKRLSLRVCRVSAYSPYAVAEHAVALLLALNRKICRAHSRTHDLNFSLDGLVGFDLHGKTVGVVGTGQIGAVFSKIMLGFGCRLLACDLNPDAELQAAGVEYVSLEQLLRQSAIVSLHVPLNPSTRHLIDSKTIQWMREGAILLNTGRGALIDTPVLIEGLKSGKIGAAGLDVYEEEENVFFRDLSDSVLKDDVLARLLTFPNVLLTSHQAFLTNEALAAIAMTTLQSVSDFENGKALENELKP